MIYECEMKNDEIENCTYKYMITSEISSKRGANKYNIINIHLNIYTNAVLDGLLNSYHTVNIRTIKLKIITYHSL